MEHNYMGLVKQLKGDHVNTSLLFNLRDKNSKSQTSDFQVRSKPRINTGTGAGTGTPPIDNSTFKLPVNINTAVFKDLTADTPLSVNEIYVDHHAGDLSDADIESEMDITAERWAVKEATFAYKEQTTEAMDMTSIIISGGVAMYPSKVSELIAGVKQLRKNGFNLKDMLVVVSEEFALDLEAEGWSVPDYSIRMSDVKSDLSRKLKVLGVVYAPVDVISGNYDEATLTPETTVDWRVYVKEYACFKTWDAADVVYRKIEHLEYTGLVPQIIGKQLMGFGQFNDYSDTRESALLKYKAEATLPLDYDEE